jgi:hypothetical protein
MNKPNVFEMVKGSYLNSAQAKAMAIASVILAAMALLASFGSVYFSYQDSVTDTQWQNEQIGLLEKILESNKLASLTLENSITHIAKDQSKSNFKVNNHVSLALVEITKLQEGNAELERLVNKHNSLSIAARRKEANK